MIIILIVNVCEIKLYFKKYHRHKWAESLAPFVHMFLDHKKNGGIPSLLDISRNAEKKYGSSTVGIGTPRPQNPGAVTSDGATRTRH